MSEGYLVLDSGAVSTIAKGQKEARVAVNDVVRQGLSPFVPTVVIAESTTGTKRDALVNAFLKSCEIIELDEALAREAAFLRAQLRGAGAIDAIVVATADRLPSAVIMTGDVHDIRRLASVRGRSRVVGV